MSKRGFTVVKIYHYNVPVAERYSFDVERVTKPKPSSEIAMAIIDLGTAAEGAEYPLTPEERASSDPDWEPRSREQMADLLKEAIKGTPMEGLDDEPERTLPTQLPPGP
jgi:hypothetical protein